RKTPAAARDFSGRRGGQARAGAGNRHPGGPCPRPVLHVFPAATNGNRLRNGGHVVASGEESFPGGTFWDNLGHRFISPAPRVGRLTPATPPSIRRARRGKANLIDDGGRELTARRTPGHLAV